MVKNCRNDAIPHYALRGIRAETVTGNMSTDPGAPYYWGYLPKNLAGIFGTMRDRISQVVYSYATPIAVCIDGVWIIPDVTYSPSTSSNHQCQLYMLGGYYVPWDCSAEELERVIAGKMKYLRDRKVGRWVPGPNWEPGC